MGKMQDIFHLVGEWGTRTSAIHQLRAILGNLLYIAQCCSSARLFLNQMLTTLRDCPETSTISLTSEFQKDLQWFKQYAASSNGMSMTEEGTAYQDLHGFLLYRL